MSANTNCLEGVACPACGQDGRVLITATVLVALIDDGIDDSYDYEWESDATAVCPTCDFHGTWGMFHIPNPDQRPAGVPA